MRSPLYNLNINAFLATLGIAPRYIANLDSATTTLRATARYLHGKDLPPVGIAPPVVAPLINAIGQLPEGMRETLYTWSGWLDAAPVRQVHHLRAETVSRWVVKQYPRRHYPAIMLGSSNGAAVHLCAALGIPWLPQTVLVQARRTLHPDEPRQDLEWGREPVQRLLDHNPDLRVYQMHDPNQDRLMLERVAYFRVKRLQLGSLYEQFLHENLAPGGTIFLLECQDRWPSTRVTDRHIYQFGGRGGITLGEYFHGGPRVEAYLQRRESHRRQWDPPEPTGEWPEAEWGFDPELRHDVERFARQHGYRIRRIAFRDPEDFSSFVADLYRWWYRQRGISLNRLLIESFTYLQPWWALRLGAVPFWAVFNGQPSVDRLKRYLDQVEPYDDIYATMFSNSIDSIGLAPITQWQEILQRARRRSRFVGVDLKKYPRDFSSFVRYYTELKTLDNDCLMPAALGLDQLDEFVTQAGEHYPVRWIDAPVSADVEVER